MDQPGIYIIENVVNGRLYVGSSKHVPHRWHSHIRDLANRRHDNRHLQCSWNVYGSGAFLFEMKESCPRESLIERETWWVEHLGTLNPQRGYNLCPPGQPPSKCYKAKAPEGEGPEEGIPEDFLLSLPPPRPYPPSPREKTPFNVSVLDSAKKAEHCTACQSDRPAFMCDVLDIPGPERIQCLCANCALETAGGQCMVYTRISARRQWKHEALMMETT